MSDAKRTPRIVPPPVVEDGSGYRRTALCPLCGKTLARTVAVWRHKLGDPPDLRRVMHLTCARNYDIACRAGLS